MKKPHTLLAGALLALLTGVAAGLLLCQDGICRVIALDRAGLALFHALRSDGTDRLAAALTWAGSLALLLPVALARAAWLRRQQRPWQEAAFVPATGAAPRALSWRGGSPAVLRL